MLCSIVLEVGIVKATSIIEFFLPCGSSLPFWDLLHVTCWLALVCVLLLLKNRKLNNIRYSEIVLEGLGW